MKIARYATTPVATTTHYDADISEEEEYVDEPIDGQRSIADENQVNADAGELSLEAIIAEKEEEAGRELNEKEREYLSLQIEQQKILQIKASKRTKKETDRYKEIRSRLRRRKPMEDFLNLPTKKCKSTAERMRIYRAKMSSRSKQEIRSKDCSRKAGKQIEKLK